MSTDRNETDLDLLDNFDDDFAMMPEDSGKGAASSSSSATPPVPDMGGEAPVPRIAIHFFCRQEATAAAASRAAADRRLQRTTPKVFRGGLTEATAVY